MGCCSRSYQNYKLKHPMDHSDFGSEDRELDTCCGRICSPSKGTMLRDIMRGLLVLVVLAVISVIIFLLCYFLIHDLENKEEKAVEDLVSIFQETEEIPQADFSISNDGSGNKLESFHEKNPKPKFPHEVEEIHQNMQNEKASSNQDIMSPKTETLTPKEPFLPIGFEDTSINSNAEAATEALANDELEDFFEYEIVKATSVATKAENECMPLDTPLCAGSMPWVVGALPNWVNDTTIQELEQSTAQFQVMLMDLKCSVYSSQYICAILEPPCGPEGVPLPPCKAFCQDVLGSCSTVINQEQHGNPAFECSRFPDSRDPNVCVDINRVSSTPPVIPDTTTQFFPEENRNPQPTEGREAIQINEVSDTPPVVAPIFPERPRPIPERREPLVIVTPEPLDQEVEEEPLICDHSKFLCEDGSDCLSYSSVCDGIQHCLDNSDEWSCSKPEPSFIENNRRPSLSEMLLGSKLVAVPTDPLASATDNQEFLGPVRPEAEPEVSMQRKSLASLLSSSGTPARPFNVNKQPEDFDRTPQRTLSSILSSRRSSL